MTAYRRRRIDLHLPWGRARTREDGPNEDRIRTTTRGRYFWLCWSDISAHLWKNDTSSSWINVRSTMMYCYLFCHAHRRVEFPAEMQGTFFFLTCSGPGPNQRWSQSKYLWCEDVNSKTIRFHELWDDRVIAIVMCMICYCGQRCCSHVCIIWTGCRVESGAMPHTFLASVFTSVMVPNMNSLWCSVLALPVHECYDHGFKEQVKTSTVLTGLKTNIKI